MDEFWGIVIAIVFVIGLVAKWYYGWQRNESYRSINQMNERDKRRGG